ncbi:hypothetical protein SERLA73DRAFT_183072 [Serpula lacrymans var. lacrymans S7.3]|uniref:Acyl-CoA dehydrogenase/oxidase C-terminal domain-containing protein n=2 Tax=Serpula lacrymans var. lacrymans TaxID=341189 RepID=F8Q1J3_SERL3|nr:uncharacterized protein SERLADRAFT_470053 [Serpula lacrymans var. lacrymans S7.9]EGN98171.1 hypothetical protein SERLA73DRAFT_183072 [Serpula lacrymans var. lacrymans S7.3]EGO23747.1 hypothetical protein SERLADRAFT_470053 [Serpula lacrymans var. lacrymans S7.9]
MGVEEGFQPIPYLEGNPYTTDPALPGLLKRLLPPSVAAEVEPDLVRFGDEVITSIRAISERVAPPRLTQYNHWGQRVDVLETSEGWRDLKAVCFKEGMPGIFYERKYNEYSRLYGFAKIHLMAGDSHVIHCPMSMTDGCARVLELIGTPEMKRELLPRLISRDPSTAFTSGQWMTERPGGSDVSLTETTATPTEHAKGTMWPEFQLNGFKWFSSATDSNISVALARTGDTKDGSRSLSLFLVPLRLPLIRDISSPEPSPISNGIYVHRLKNKIGTHIVPTAELSLQSTKAYLLGELNQGVKNIIPVLNITRIYSGMSGIGGIRKCLAIATTYSQVRAIRSGTQVLKDNALHVAQLASISLTYRALTHLTYGTILMMGKVETGVASVEEQHLLRILTAVVKAFTAEKAAAAMEEAMTTLGGMGYMEEVGIGRSIRDALVEKIWEGTTAVLAMEIVRSAKNPTTFAAFGSWSLRVIDSVPDSLKVRLQHSLSILQAGIQQTLAVYKASTDMSPLVPRPALLLVGHTASSVFLLEHAVWSWNTKDTECETDVEVFRRWVVEGGLSGVMEEVRIAQEAVKSRIATNRSITYGSKL